MKTFLKLEHFLDETVVKPNDSESILAWNGSRFAVVYRNMSGNKYYVEQDNAHFTVIFWCPLPKFK